MIAAIYSRMSTTDQNASDEEFRRASGRARACTPCKRAGPSTTCTCTCGPAASCSGCDERAITAVPPGDTQAITRVILVAAGQVKRRPTVSQST